MIVIGLTGGIASGKNLVASLLAGEGVFLIDADKIAGEVVLPGCPAWKKIVQSFGAGILGEGGNINRSRLGGIVFHDPAKLKQLNRIIHPEVLIEIKERIRAVQVKNEYGLVVVNVPLLIEVGWQRWVDIVLLVTVPIDIQTNRLIKRNDFSPEEASRRISCQMDLKEKEKYADYIIDNSADREHTRLQVLKVLADIRTSFTASS